MTRNTQWQNLVIKIGAEFTVPNDIGNCMIKRGVAKEKEKPAMKHKKPEKSG